jgi:hypothetical protein
MSSAGNTSTDTAGSSASTPGLDDDQNRFVARPTVNLVIADPSLARSIVDRLSRNSSDDGFVRMDDAMDQNARRSGPGPTIATPPHSPGDQ